MTRIMKSVRKGLGPPSPRLVNHTEVLDDVLVTFRACSRHCYEPCEIAGFSIPAGVQVQMNLTAVHMNPDLWGPEDPAKCVPERYVVRPQISRFLSFRKVDCWTLDTNLYSQIHHTNCFVELNKHNQFYSWTELVLFPIRTLTKILLLLESNNLRDIWSRDLLHCVCQLTSRPLFFWLLFSGSYLSGRLPGTLSPGSRSARGRATAWDSASACSRSRWCSSGFSSVTSSSAAPRRRFRWRRRRGACAIRSMGSRSN